MTNKIDLSTVMHRRIWKRFHPRNTFGQNNTQVRGLCVFAIHKKVLWRILDRSSGCSNMLSWIPGIEDRHTSGNNAAQNTVASRMQFCTHLVISSWYLEDMMSTNVTGSDQSTYLFGIFPREFRHCWQATISEQQPSHLHPGLPPHKQPVFRQLDDFCAKI